MECSNCVPKSHKKIWKPHLLHLLAIRNAEAVLCSSPSRYVGLPKSHLERPHGESADDGLPSHKAPARGFKLAAYIIFL